MQSSQHPLSSHLGTLGKGCTMQQSLQFPFPSLKTHSYLIESALVRARTCMWVSVSRGRVMSLGLWLMRGRGWTPPGASWWQFSRVSLFLSETTVETLRLPADSKMLLLLPLSHFSPYLGCSQALRHLLVAQPALPGTVYCARKGEITVGGEAAGLGDRKTSLLATFILLQPGWGRSPPSLPQLAGNAVASWWQSSVLGGGDAILVKSANLHPLLCLWQSSFLLGEVEIFCLECAWKLTNYAGDFLSMKKKSFSPRYKNPTFPVSISVRCSQMESAYFFFLTSSRESQSTLKTSSSL